VEIIIKMKENSIDHRDAKDVLNKISHLQCMYNQTRDWKEITGEGLRLDGTSESSIHGTYLTFLNTLALAFSIIYSEC
jgi:hypothetical protein